jgi:Dehydrogenases with different specificities (related to short-chain alcohol dehydrogenases)
MQPKIALITGGSRGLGRAAALALADQDVHAILTYQHRAADAQVVVEEIKNRGAKAVALPLDVGSSSSFPTFAAQVGEALQHEWQRDSFDFLVNNAGMGINAPFTEFTEEQFDQLYRVHLKGVFFLTQALLPYVAQGGRILNVSSGLARFTYPGYGPYAAMKGGVEVLTRYLAKELGSRGIAVNVIAPGAIETDFGGGHVRDNRDVNAFLASQTALGRVGKPEDIGGAVAALLTGGLGWMTAQRVEVSGGMFL